VLTNDIKTGQPYTLGNPSYNGSIFKDIGLFSSEQGLNPVTLSKTPDGGRIKFDQVAIGGGGVELASWNTPVPQVGYTVAIVYYDHRDVNKNYPIRQMFRVDAFLDGKSVPVLTNFDELVKGTATELKFGPTYTGTASLIDSEKILVVDPKVNFHGDVRLTAVDLSEEAVGPINGQGSSDQTAQAARSKRSAKRAAQAANAVVTPVVAPKVVKGK
jgi:hypothetical protein